MPTPKSARYANWGPANFTLYLPTDAVGTPTGANYLLDGITSCSHDDGNELLKFAGGNDKSYSTVVSSFAEPKVALTFADETVFDPIRNGATGKLTVVRPSAKNGTAVGGGGYTVTLDQAITEKAQIAGQFKQWGNLALAFIGNHPDGTNPLTITPF